MSEGINWKKGDVLETPKGEQFMFGHYERSGFWVHRITKSGKMDDSSMGRYMSRDGVKPATYDSAKRGGWANRVAAKAKSATNKRAVLRPHCWSGAGYVCLHCGAVKDTRHGDEGCSGSGETGFDVWLYHAGAGWWLDESKVETQREATKILSQKIGIGNVIAGAVLPAGQPLGLFTKTYGEK